MRMGEDDPRSYDYRAGVALDVIPTKEESGLRGNC
jgi:hypothetical protein